jgi:hypothetical protein
MTIPNRITLDDLPSMSIDEIIALSGEQLALAEDEACEQLRAAKSLYDWIAGAIALRLGARTGPGGASRRRQCPRLCRRRAPRPGGR